MSSNRQALWLVKNWPMFQICVSGSSQATTVTPTENWGELWAMHQDVDRSHQTFIWRHRKHKFTVTYKVSFQIIARTQRWMVQSNYSTFNSNNELSPTVSVTGSVSSSGPSSSLNLPHLMHKLMDKIQNLVIAKKLHRLQAVVRAYSTSECSGGGERSKEASRINPGVSLIPNQLDCCCLYWDGLIPGTEAPSPAGRQRDRRSL